MPQIFDTPWEEATITLSGTTLLSTALIFASGTTRARIYTTTNAAMHAYAGTDNLTIGSHYFPIPADNALQVGVRDVPSGQADNRAAGHIIVVAVPDDEETVVIGDGTTTVTFVWDTDDDGIVKSGTEIDSSGGTVATAAAAFAAAITASALKMTASVHYDDDNRIDWVATAAGLTIAIRDDSAGSDLTITHLDMANRDIQFVGAVVVSTVINVQTEGE